MHRRHCSQVLDQRGRPSTMLMLCVGQMRAHFPQPLHASFVRKRNHKRRTPSRWNAPWSMAERTRPYFSTFNGRKTRVPASSAATARLIFASAVASISAASSAVGTYDIGSQLFGISTASASTTSKPFAVSAAFASCTVQPTSCSSPAVARTNARTGDETAGRLCRNSRTIRGAPSEYTGQQRPTKSNPLRSGTEPRLISESAVS